MVGNSIRYKLVCSYCSCLLPISIVGLGKFLNGCLFVCFVYIVLGGGVVLVLCLVLSLFCHFQFVIACSSFSISCGSVMSNFS
jgi:hypothetical protein